MINSNMFAKIEKKNEIAAFSGHFLYFFAVERMLHQALFCQLFIFCTFSPVIGIRIDADTTTWGK